MSDFTNSGTNFSLPTSTQQKPVLVPVPVEVPVAVPVAVAHTGVHHEPAPTVSAPTLDSFSPQLDVNAITNSGTPSTQQRTTAPAPATGSVSAQANDLKNQVSNLASNATNIANQAGQVASAKLDEFTAGKPTSDPTIHPVGPPSHDQSAPMEHIDGLTRGIAGVILTAPLLAAEKLSQTHLAQQVASHLPGHATGGPTLAEQAQPYAQQAVGQATTLATSARENAVPLAQSAATQAQNLAGQAAGYATSAFNAAYSAVQHKVHEYQPNPADTLEEVANKVEQPHHSTAVTAVEPSPVLPIDGAALLPSQGTDRDIDGVDAKFAGGSATPQHNKSEGVIGGNLAHDQEQGATSTREHEAHPAAVLPDEASSTLKNDNHAKNSTQDREAHGAIYAQNIDAHRPAAEPIAPVHAYNELYPKGGNHESATSTQSGPPLGVGKPIASAPVDPIAKRDTPSSHSAGIASEPRPAEPTPAQFTSSTPASSQPQGSSSLTNQAKNVDYDDARQKADTAADKGASAASSALDSAAGKAGVNKDHVPSADQIKSTLDSRVTEKVTGTKPGEKREHIDPSPPTDHDHAQPQFLEGEPKAGLGSKIKHIFHKDKENSDF